MTMTATYGRHGSLTGTANSGGRGAGAQKGIAGAAAGTAGHLRRKSSTTLNLKFLAVGKEKKIAPINEDRNAEGDNVEEGGVAGSMIPQSLLTNSRSGTFRGA